MDEAEAEQAAPEDGAELLPELGTLHGLNGDGGEAGRRRFGEGGRTVRLGHLLPPGELELALSVWSGVGSSLRLVGPAIGTTRTSTESSLTSVGECSSSSTSSGPASSSAEHSDIWNESRRCSGYTV